jgi:hypothetical protein
VCPKWGYYLTTYMSKLDESWNYATIEFSVYAWKCQGRRQYLGDAVRHANVDAERLFQLVTTIGYLLPEMNHMYNLNLGMVEIRELCDIMVCAKVIGDAPGPCGGLVSTSSIFF